MLRFNRKGVVLLLLLGTLLITTSLAGIATYIVVTQSRLSQHQINRIKAYYAALAGINLAMEKLRVGAWGTTVGVPYTLCNNTGCDAYDYDIPFDGVSITISDPDAAGLRTINANVTYTYTTP